MERARSAHATREGRKRGRSLSKQKGRSESEGASGMDVDGAAGDEAPKKRIHTKPSRSMSRGAARLLLQLMLTSVHVDFMFCVLYAPAVFVVAASASITSPRASCCVVRLVHRQCTSLYRRFVAGACMHSRPPCSMLRGALRLPRVHCFQGHASLDSIYASFFSHASPWAGAPSMRHLRTVYVLS